MGVPLLVATEESSLLARVRALRDEHASLWRSTPDHLPNIGPAVGPLRHFSNARAATRLIDQLSSEASAVLDDPAERHAWQETVRARLQVFGDERLGWPEGYRRLMFGDGFFNAAADFARSARAFDPDLPLGDLWQAMRNVWIGNSFQMLMQRPVESTPALFAYSMLYPLTDNLLDDPALTPRAKRAFNERFGWRLAGLPAHPAGAREAAVFRLVDTIERQYSRRRHPEVFDSLLAIHHGQVLSLTQQDDVTIGDEQLLAISCEKGGSSVLADLYLVAGRASAAEERFAFGYGVALQLMDDLQDTTSDGAAQHQTIFTRAAAGGTLDRATSKLVQFIERVLARSECFAEQTLAGQSLPKQHLADQIDLLRRNCLSLVVGAVADQPSRFTARFRRAVAGQWPFSLRALRRLRRRAQRRFDGAEGALYRLADGAETRPSPV